MKSKNALVIISIIIAVVTMAAGVSVIVNRYLKRKELAEGYIETDCSPDEFDAE